MGARETSQWEKCFVTQARGPDSGSPALMSKGQEQSWVPVIPILRRQRRVDPWSSVASAAALVSTRLSQ